MVLRAAGRQPIPPPVLGRASPRPGQSRAGGPPPGSAPGRRGVHGRLQRTEQRKGGAGGRGGGPPTPAFLSSLAGAGRGTLLPGRGFRGRVSAASPAGLASATRVWRDRSSLRRALQPGTGPRTRPGRRARGVGRPAAGWTARDPRPRPRPRGRGRRQPWVAAAQGAGGAGAVVGRGWWWFVNAELWSSLSSRVSAFPRPLPGHAFDRRPAFRLAGLAVSWSPRGLRGMCSP